ncbi:MAG: LysR family transcriptional regulator [Vulcanimicrobiaceae bacterium]
MEIRELRAVVAVVRNQHVTRAADELGITQPTLSQQIARLEAELGVELVERNGRGIRPTSAGRALAERAEYILEDLRRAEEEVRANGRELRGKVVVGSTQLASETMLPRVLARFHAVYPGVDVSLREDVSERVLAAVRRGACDVGIAHFVGRRPPRDLTIVSLFSETLAVAVSPTHRLAARRSVPIAELRDEPMIAFKSGSSLNALPAVSRSWPRVAFESGDTLTIRALVAEGLGFAFLPESMGDLPGPRIAFVPLAGRRIRRAISLATLARRRTAPATAALAEFLVAQLRRA